MLRLAVAFLVILLSPHSLVAQLTTRASQDFSGSAGNNDSSAPAISHDGRIVAFESLATNLDPNHAAGQPDVFVKDRLTELISLVSVGLFGVPANAGSEWPGLSPDGGLVSFSSSASNLVFNDANTKPDVFLHDRETATTTLVSVSSAGVQGNEESTLSAVSEQGQRVVFQSRASNLVAGDTNNLFDVFVHDIASATTIRVSVTSAGVQGNGASWNPGISADGRFVVFQSSASNLVSGDTNDAIDVFVRDLQTATTIRVSVDSRGNEGNDNSLDPCIAGNGGRVGFRSYATNLVGRDTNGFSDIFVRDLQTSITSRVSLSSAAEQGNLPSSGVSLSHDGRHVGFISSASNLVTGDSNGVTDVFVRNLETGKTRRASVSSFGVEANQFCPAARLSGDGRVIAFESDATNLVLRDLNGARDIFVHGPEITLEVNTPIASVGTYVSFTTWGGTHNNPAMLFVTAAGGVPVFQPLPIIGFFDVSGIWFLAGTVMRSPGIDVCFRTLAVGQSGNLVQSNDVTLSLL